MISQIDISDILSSVHVPTLVIHCTEDTLIGVEHARFLAEHIPGARLLSCRETIISFLSMNRSLTQSRSF